MSQFKLQPVLAVIVFLFCTPLLTYAQGHELPVPPSTGDTFLNNAILGDTTATGDRADLDRVYVLERDGVYLMNARVNNIGFPVRIRGAEGDGRKPVIFLVTNAQTQAFPPHFFLMGDDLWLKDLILVGFVEALAGQIANNPPRLIDSGAPGLSLTIDGCVVTQGRGEHIRFPQPAGVIKLINSIFGNMGDLGTSNLGAGRCIDMRNTSCDSLIIENSSFINSQDRIVRHLSSVASIKYFRFNHNTIVNGLTYHGLISLGFTGNEAILTNNLFIDTNIAGGDTDRTRQVEFAESAELDPRNSQGRIVWILSVPNDSTQWTVSGNYYSVSPEVQAFYDAHAAEGVAGEGPPVTHNINSKIGADSTTAFIKELVTLANRPAPQVNMAEWYRRPDGGNKRKNTPCACWNRTTDDYQRKSFQYLADTLDCSYATNLVAYTGADGVGQFPAGDLNWFPDKKEAWEDFISSVEPTPGVVVKEFLLKQNYPNPFNPTTTIEFHLVKSERVTVTVYNALGQVVATLVNNERLDRGAYRVAFEGAKFSSGLYFYQIKAGSFSEVKKMMLLK